MEITYNFTKICSRCHKEYGTDYPNDCGICYSCSDRKKYSGFATIRKRNNDIKKLHESDDLRVEKI